MPKISLEKLTISSGTNYPPPYNTPCLARHKISPGDAGGLSQFGAHIVSLPPGSWSSQRHWHSEEDELILILKGHPTFIDEDGPQTLSPGDITTHKAGDPNGHHMKNETSETIEFLIIGGRTPETDHAHYPDIDMDLPSNGSSQRHYKRKNGTPYETS